MSGRSRGRAAVGVVTAALALTAASAQAAGPDPTRELPFVWTTRTLAPDQQSLQVWVTPRVARADPTFLLTELRFVWATGLLPSLDAQVALEPTLTSTQLTTSAEPRVSTLWRWAPLKADGPLGVGLLAKGSLGLDAAQLEARLLLDKALGRVLLAVNASVARDFFWSGRSGIDTRLEESLAARFAISPAASVGLEARLRSAFQGRDYQGSALWLGPSLTFSFKYVWVNVGLQVQLGADKAPADKGNGEPLELRDNERVDGRVLLGFPVP